MGGVKLLKEVLKNIFKKPSTIEFPRVKTPVEKDARGQHYVDLMKCIGCSLCAIECPANAIVMEKVADGVAINPRNTRKIYPVIDYRKCIFCYRCVTVCPTNAYITTNEYRLATTGEAVSRELSLSSTYRG